MSATVFEKVPVDKLSTNNSRKKMKRKSFTKQKILSTGPFQMLQNNTHSEELKQILKSSEEMEQADVTLRCDNGTIMAHSFILGLKSPVFRAAMLDFPPGFQYQLSCPGVRLETLRQVLQLFYEGESLIDNSDLDEFKSVVEAYEISLYGTNLYKEEPALEDTLDPGQSSLLGEPTPKRKRGRPKKTDVSTPAPARDPEDLQEGPAGPVTRKKTINFKELVESADEEGTMIPARDVLGLELQNELLLERAQASDSDYEPFCSPVPPTEGEKSKDAEDIQVDDSNDASYEPSLDDEETREDPESDSEKKMASAVVKKKRSEKFEGDHSCGVCKKDYETLSALREHYSALHKRDGRYFCTDCEYTSNNMSALVVHRRRHTGERPFSCTFCGRCFGHSGTLSEHMNLHTGNKPYKCPTCGSAFAQRKKFAVHRCSSPSPRESKSDDPNDLRFVCDECGRRFVNRKALAHHKIYHTEREPKPKDILCDICGRGFSTKYLLKAHSAIHTRRKTFVCEICGRGYFTEKSLENHLNNHSGDYIYQCSLCERKFKDQSKLAFHEQTHPGLKELVCQFCNEQFRLRSQLENHMLLHTNDGTKYVCDCGKVFLNYKYLQKHRLVHSRRHRCTFCRKTFETDEQLRAHEELHETGVLPVTKNNQLAKEMRNMLRIGCSHCDAKFRNEEEFAEHAIEHETEEYDETREEGEIGYTASGAVGEIVYYTEEGEVKSAEEEWSYEVVMPHGEVHQTSSMGDDYSGFEH